MCGCGLFPSASAFNTVLLGRCGGHRTKLITQDFHPAEGVEEDKKEQDKKRTLRSSRTEQHMAHLLLYGLFGISQDRVFVHFISERLNSLKSIF